jgi:hypothetical protein
MNTNFLFDAVISSSFSAVSEVLGLLAHRRTGVYRDASERLVVELRFFKASITRNGETTYYSRHTNGNTTVLTRLIYQVVLNHLDNFTITDSTGVRFTKDPEPAPQRAGVLSFQESRAA